jgi:hypothetical protein
MAMTPAHLPEQLTVEQAITWVVTKNIALTLACGSWPDHAAVVVPHLSEVDKARLSLGDEPLGRSGPALAGHPREWDSWLSWLRAYSGSSLRGEVQVLADGARSGNLPTFDTSGLPIQAAHWEGSVLDIDTSELIKKDGTRVHPRFARDGLLELCPWISPPKNPGAKATKRSEATVWLKEHYPNGVPASVKNSTVLEEIRKDGIHVSERTLGRALGRK